MASSAVQLNNFVRRIRLITCSRILAKGRRMQISGIWSSLDNGDIYSAWRHSLSSKDMLPEVYDLDASYLDTITAAENRPAPIGSVVMVHGTPGSHNDFKYMVPPLMEKNIRAIAPNLPGHGLTDAPPTFRQSSDERAEFVLDFVNNGLGLKKVDIILGHSAGCYPLWNLLTDEFFKQNDPLCGAAIMLNPGGTATAHKSVRPYWAPRFISKLQHTQLRWIIGWLSYLIWNYVLKLRVPSPEAAMMSTDMIANVGFRQLGERVRQLGSDPAGPRLLIIYAEDDQFIETERSEETAALLGIELASIFHVSSSADLDNAIRHVRTWWTSNDGNRHAAVAFKKGLGGHYLQKHQAGFLVSCIEILVSNK